MSNATLEMMLQEATRNGNDALQTLIEHELEERELNSFQIRCRSERGE